MGVPCARPSRRRQRGYRRLGGVSGVRRQLISALQADSGSVWRRLNFQAAREFAPLAAAATDVLPPRDVGAVWRVRAEAGGVELHAAVSFPWIATTLDFSGPPSSDAPSSIH